MTLVSTDKIYFYSNLIILVILLMGGCADLSDLNKGQSKDDNSVNVQKNDASSDVEVTEQSKDTNSSSTANEESNDASSDVEVTEQSKDTNSSSTANEESNDASSDVGVNFDLPEEILGQWSTRYYYQSIGDYIFGKWLIIDIQSNKTVHTYSYARSKKWHSILLEYLLDEESCVGQDAVINEQYEFEIINWRFKLTPSNGKLLVRLNDLENQQESTEEFQRDGVPAACEQ
ncbi:hypothetical protein WDW89_03810 [Deltaproteobacteria bacterium TL4]